MKVQYLAEWAVQPFQGKGVRCFSRNKVGNDWLSSVLAPGEEIDLMKMRSNVFPVRTSLVRAEEAGGDVTVRRCKAKPETLGLVLGECTAGRGSRIKRHDDIVSTIEQQCKSKGWTVAREQLFDGDKRPLA